MWESPDPARQPASGEAVGENEIFHPPASSPSRDRVLLLVAHRRNRLLLTEWFASQSTYDAIDGMARLDASDDAAPDAGAWTPVADPPTDGDPGESAPPADPAGAPDGLESEPIDLVLVDVTGLERHGAWLGRRLELEQPLPLPCLLLASESTARRFFSPGAAHDWHSLIDDVVTTPVEPALFDRRLRAYLSLRAMATELERRHDQLSLLAQVVRHDIANAATVVTGWGELLRESVEPDGVEALERVLRGGQRITEIVENSRDLTMLIDAGHDLETEALLLGPVLQMEVDAVRRVHASTTKQVAVTVESPLPVVEVVAGGMLPSVFANLLSNAVRHNDSERVEIDISVVVEQHEVVVRVSDNGPGIPDDQKTAVFEPSTKRGDSPGDGLGLSLVKRLVESYGGSAWFEDGPDGGAVACVALRRAPSGR